MGFLYSSQDFDDGIIPYIQNILTHLFIYVFGVLFGLFLILSLYQFFKSPKVKNPNPNKFWAFINDISDYVLIFNLLGIIISTAIFHSVWYIRAIAARVDIAWAYRNLILNDLENVDDLLQTDVDNSVCTENTCASDKHPFESIFKSFEHIIDVFKGFPSSTIVADSQNVYESLLQYMEITHGVGYAFIAIGVFLVLLGIIRKKQENVHFRKCFVLISIFVSFFLICTSGIFFIGGAAISDTCKNTSKIIELVTNDPTLNFYYNCDPTIAKSYPDIITEEDSIIDHFNDTNDIRFVKLGCAVDKIVTNVEKYYFKIENITWPDCCQGCNLTILDEVIDIMGNYENSTGLWGNLSCTNAHDYLHDIEIKICELFAPFFSNFILYLLLSIHVLFAFN